MFVGFSLLPNNNIALKKKKLDLAHRKEHSYSVPTSPPQDDKVQSRPCNFGWDQKRTNPGVWRCCSRRNMFVTTVQTTYNQAGLLRTMFCWVVSVCKQSFDICWIENFIVADLRLLVWVLNIFNHQIFSDIVSFRLDRYRWLDGDVC